MSNQTLPAGFTHINDAVPSHDKAVLAIREAGYIGSKYEIITARYMIEYRPLSPWRMIDMDSVHDSGSPVIGWREAPELNG